MTGSAKLEFNGDREMREILFRGKAKAKYKWIAEGEWIEGSLFCSNNENEIVCQIVTSYLQSNEDGSVMVVAYEVDPDTVCQYIGLTDKNGRKIFDGDIVRAIYKPKDKDLTINDFIIKWDKYYCKYVGYYARKENVYNPLLLGSQTSFEVIGNIFDGDSSIATSQ